MKVEHVPKIKGRYWPLLILSSVFGANAGDFLSDAAGCGHPLALLLLVLGFACVRVAARLGSGRHPAGFWLALAALRGAAAVGADVLHDLRWSVLLAALACVTLFAWTRYAGRPGAAQRTVDRLWWWTMFVTGAVGSALADALAAGLSLGFARASLVLGAIALLLQALRSVAARRRRPAGPGLFWLSVLVLHATAGAVADLIAQRVLGLELSTFAVGVGFGLVLTALRILADGNLPSGRPRA